MILNSMDEQNPVEEIIDKKRPMWQIGLAIIVVFIVIVAIGFTLNKPNNPNNSQSALQPTQSIATQMPSKAAEVLSDNIYLMKTDAVKGQYLTDFAGTTLYTFDKDTTGVSNCEKACAVNWPPYTSGATAQSQFPKNISIITRADGIKQFAWMGKPLYYYASDKKPGDINGDGVGKVWHIIKP